eukprot:GHVN01060401.1.p1 GENE.GHVN01060401.1~~GHVN01060401.1.p1  ORF type:complete len:389 (-),score=36.05 GHVN01060401.1:2258-3424(-)
MAPLAQGRPELMPAARIARHPAPALPHYRPVGPGGHLPENRIYYPPVNLDDVASPKRKVVIHRRVDELTAPPPKTAPPVQEVLSPATTPTMAPPATEVPTSTEDLTPEDPPQKLPQSQDLPQEPAEELPHEPTEEQEQPTGEQLPVAEESIEAAESSEIDEGNRDVEFTPPTPYHHLSNPANPGVDYCWKKIVPQNSHRSWAHVVPWDRCQTDFQQDPNPYIVSNEPQVCTLAGGMEITRLDKHDPPLYDVACIDYHIAKASQHDACFSIITKSKGTIKLMKLSAAQASQFCSKEILPKPLYDHLHLWGSDPPGKGGISELAMCNGGGYFGAVAFRSAVGVPHPAPSGVKQALAHQGGAFQASECIPPSPRPSYQCSGQGVNCRDLGE